MINTSACMARGVKYIIDAMLDSSAQLLKKTYMYRSNMIRKLIGHLHHSYFMSCAAIHKHKNAGLLHSIRLMAFPEIYEVQL